jgi:hypothetical protein
MTVLAKKADGTEVNAGGQHTWNLAWMTDEYCPNLDLSTAISTFHFPNALPNPAPASLTTSTTTAPPPPFLVSLSAYRRSSRTTSTALPECGSFDRGTVSSRICGGTEVEFGEQTHGPSHCVCSIANRQVHIVLRPGWVWGWCGSSCLRVCTEYNSFVVPILSRGAEH